MPAAWGTVTLNRLDGSVTPVTARSTVSLDGSPVLLMGPAAAGLPPVNPPPRPRQPPPWPAARDHSPPGLLLLAPRRGAHVGAQQQVAVHLSDDTGVSLLVYFVDGHVAAVHSGQRMTQDSWRWSGIHPGWHLLQVRAVDAARNWRQVSVWVQH